MYEESKSDSNVAIAILAWIAAFSAGWILISALTGTAGLALVWSIFIALLAFELSRRSFRRALLIIFLSLFTVLLRGAYALIV